MFTFYYEIEGEFKQGYQFWKFNLISIRTENFSNVYSRHFEFFSGTTFLLNPKARIFPKGIFLPGSAKVCLKIIFSISTNNFNEI